MQNFVALKNENRERNVVIQNEDVNKDDNNLDMSGEDLLAFLISGNDDPPVTVQPVTIPVTIPEPAPVVINSLDEILESLNHIEPEE